MQEDDVVIIEEESQETKYITLVFDLNKGDIPVGYQITKNPPAEDSTATLPKDYDISRDILVAKTDDEMDVLIFDNSPEELMRAIYKSKNYEWDERNPMDVEVTKEGNAEIWTLTTRNKNFIPSYDRVVSTTRIYSLGYMD